MSIINGFPQGFLGGGVDYSTSEQNTGLKWIDGKDIYSKTVDCGTLPINSSLHVNHGISNFGHLVSFSGVAYQPSGDSIVIPYPYYSGGPNNWIVEIDVITSTKIDIVTRANWEDDWQTYITLYYVKTT